MPRGIWKRAPERYWTVEDVHQLADLVEQGLTDVQIGRRLKRTPTAVNLKRKRSGIPCRTRSTLSARQVARLMGLSCSKTVSWWLEQGLLAGHKGQRRGQYRQWVVSEEALYDFVGDPRYFHLWELDAITDPELRLHAREERGGERFYTTREVAEMFFMSCSKTVYQWIAKGQLRAVRRANWLVPASALVGFVPPSERDRHGRPARRFTAAEDARLLALRSSSATWHEIAAALGRDVGSVAGRYARLTSRRREVAA